MGLPRYIINMEEILPYLLPSLGDKPLSRGYQRSKGLRITTSRKGEFEVFWRPPTTIFITGINIGVSEQAPHSLDNISMFIADEPIFETVNMKDIYQYKNFRVYRRVRPNQEIKFVYRNINRVEKDVWIDIDYHANPLLCPVAIKCISNGRELQVEYRDMCLGEHGILAPKIKDYDVIGDYYQKLTITKADVDIPKEVIFEYEKR